MSTTDARTAANHLRVAGFTANRTAGFRVRTTGDAVTVRWISGDTTEQANQADAMAAALYEAGYDIDMTSPTRFTATATDAVLPVKVRRTTSLMAEYECWRAAYLADREYVTCGYATEIAEYETDRLVPTFKMFLIQRGAARRAEQAAAWRLAA